MSVAHKARAGTERVGITMVATALVTLILAGTSQGVAAQPAGVGSDVGARAGAGGDRSDALAESGADSTGVAIAGVVALILGASLLARRRLAVRTSA